MRVRAFYCSSSAFPTQGRGNKRRNMTKKIQSNLQFASLALLVGLMASPAWTNKEDVTEFNLPHPNSGPDDITAGASGNHSVSEVKGNPNQWSSPRASTLPTFDEAHPRIPPHIT